MIIKEKIMGFSIAKYCDLLRNGISSGYDFIGFHEVGPIGQTVSRDNNLCLLRHDVDADVSAALVMAKIERQLDVSATYFLMLRSPLYNLMGRKNHMMVEEILDLGHAIGLHYDQGFDAMRNWTAARTATAIEEEAQWMEKQFNTKVSSVSFHQPSSTILQANIDTGTRINTYDRSRLVNFDYFSDSNRQFKLAELAKGNIENSFSVLFPRNLQLLIHPMWWVYNDKSTDAVWDRAINSNLQTMQEQLVETERAYGIPRQVDISLTSLS
jgi:hypothetical protein